MKEYVAVNKNAYNQLAKEYEKRLQRRSKYEEPVDNLIGLPYKYAKKTFHQIKALDIGPGRGEACTYLEKMGCEVHALDIAENILNVVKKVTTNTKLICADILTYKLPKDEYNLIYCGALIHLFTIKDAKKVLSNINLGLKPNGILFINTTVHNQSSEDYYIKNDYNGDVTRFRHKYTEKEFRELIEFNKFKILEELRTDEKDRNKVWLGFICQKSV